MDNMSVQERVIAIVKAQQDKGLRKYGRSVDDAELSVIDWINHTQEELADAMIYLEKLKGELCKIKMSD